MTADKFSGPEVSSPGPEPVVYETTRPNGKVYRRRKTLEAVPCIWNEEATVVLIYGTHDVDSARELALQEWRREGLGDDLPEPVLEWVKVVPWDAFGSGHDRTIMSVDGNTRGSWPCLRYGGDW